MVLEYAAVSAKKYRQPYRPCWSAKARQTGRHDPEFPEVQFEIQALIILHKPARHIYPHLHDGSGWPSYSNIPNYGLDNFLPETFVHSGIAVLNKALIQCKYLMRSNV